MSTELSLLSDAELVTRCRDGQEAAWQALVGRYQRLLYTVARRAGLGEHDAADVLQACFEALFQHLHALSQPERLQAWLVTTARRETLKQLHHQRRHPALATITQAADDAEDDRGDPAARQADEALLPPEQLEALQSQHRLRRALATLDKRSRELLTYLYLHDPPLDYDEIALRLDMAAGSIGPTRARSLDKLRRALDALP